MVHNDLDTFFMGVCVECVDVEIRIWSDEIEYIILAVSSPVFPTDVPSLHKKGVKSVFCGKIDVFAHVLIVRTVPSVRLCGSIICLPEMYRLEIVGVGPT